VKKRGFSKRILEALGLKTPWQVADAQMDMGAQRVTIIVE